MATKSILPTSIAEQARIRPALPGDIAQLMALEWTRPAVDRIERSQLRLLLTQGHTLTLVDEFHGKIRGYVLLLLCRDSTRIRIHNQTVLPAWQRHGVACGLLDAAERITCILERQHLLVDVPESNLPALQWFLGQGYQPCCEHPHPDRKGISLYHLEKTHFSRPRPQWRRTQRLAFTLDKGRLIH